MKIYLDIDETILINDTKNGHFAPKPANHLKQFLKHILENHNVYWLTTHCNGDATVPVAYLSRHFDEELVSMIMRIRPTKWNIRKIEAINLDEDFLWFDDVLMDSEEKLLKSKGKLNSYVRVNLDKDPNFYLKYLNI